MATIDVTLNTVADGPFQVLALYGATPPTGVTVVPTAPLKPPRIAASLVIEADPANGSATVYWGDAQLTPATAEKGLILLAGGSNQKTNVPLAGEYVNASAGGAVLHIAADGGFQ